MEVIWASNPQTYKALFKSTRLQILCFVQCLTIQRIPQWFGQPVLEKRDKTIRIQKTVSMPNCSMEFELQIQWQSQKIRWVDRDLSICLARPTESSSWTVTGATSSRRLSLTMLSSESKWSSEKFLRKALQLVALPTHLTTISTKKPSQMSTTSKMKMRNTKSSNSWKRRRKKNYDSK